MKTFNRFTDSEKTLHSAKSALAYNFEVLVQIGHFLTSKVSDEELIKDINQDLEDFIENTDLEISKFLKHHETDNEKNID